MHTMIKELEATPLSSNNYTKYLDSQYGCTMNSELFIIFFWFNYLI